LAAISSFSAATVSGYGTIATDPPTPPLQTVIAARVIEWSHALISFNRRDVIAEELHRRGPAFQRERTV